MRFAPTPTELLARARADLRMGVPVVLHGADGGALILAVETLGQARLADLRAMGGTPVIALTARRAETLKARAYDGDIARIALPQSSGLAWLRAMADPADDLATPMKGPFHTLRQGDAGLHRLAIALTKSAQLLPAALVLALPAPTDFAQDHGLTAVASWAPCPSHTPWSAPACLLPQPRRANCTFFAPMMAGKSITPLKLASPCAMRRYWRGCIRPVSPAM